MYLVGIHFFASGNAPFPRVNLFAKFSSDILDAIGCRSSLGRDEGVGGWGGEHRSDRPAATRPNECVLT